MKTISSREFQLKFGKYREGGENIKVDGYGVYVPEGCAYSNLEDEIEDLKPNVLSAKPIVMSRNGDLFVKNAAYNKFRDVLEKPEAVVEEKCCKCGKVAFGRLRYWDEVEMEDVVRFFCKFCSKVRGVKLDPL